MSRTNTFGATNEYSVTYPDKRVFAFSPYKCVVTGTEIQQKVIFNFNGKTLTRYTGSDKKVTIELSTLFRSFFVGVETGNVLAHGVGVYTNTASKLIQTDKTINVAIGAKNSNMTFDILYGALQQGETEPTEETIYRFGTLPLTITRNIGDRTQYGPLILENEGAKCDIDIQKAYFDDKKEPYFFTESVDPTITNRRINVIDMPVCPESYYLRWIDKKTSSYKYYNFLLGRNTKTSSNGASFNYPVNSLDATDGLYKNSTQILKKISTETITLVEPSADYLQQAHIKTIFDSPKVWLYLGDNNWIEVNTSESTFEVVRNDGKKEIQVNIVMPQKYNIEI